HQKELGIAPIIITSPKHGASHSHFEEIDGINVYRTTKNDFGAAPFIREVRLIDTLCRKIKEIIEIEKPDIIHAHSPSLNGIAALMAGRKYDIPVVYEVRAFWEDAAVDHGTFKEGSFKYRVSRFIETELLKRVDSLFTICEGLKGEMISRGIGDDRITVIPNCVDAELFTSVQRNEDIVKKYSLENKIVFGFIGSFYHYEGLDILIDGFQRLVPKINNAKLLLVGDGSEKDNLYKKVKEKGLHNDIIFTGKVPHAEVKSYYSVIDFLVYPRESMRLTELVTPLKPLEAMAMGKIVAGSDVGGIKELVTNGKDGFLFKAGDTEDLSRLLIELAVNRENLKAVSSAAIQTVRMKHNWESAVKRYLPVYGKLVK
ncbi:MAG: glycosyltransferase, exosortase A system-associated, partial [Nitrospirae bacterium]|nr:glycosyltransferase, exosortase A system-associated [Nitrospirota bacterium]